VGTSSSNRNNERTAGLSVGNLEIWSEAMDIVEAAYTLTRNWPEAEKYGLTSQTRRAVVSIPANLAEGVGRGTAAELSRYSRIALGSAYELSTLPRLAHDFGYIDRAVFEKLNSHVSSLTKQISAFISYQEGRK